MSTLKINRNAPCPCGSGKKYKQCCMQKDQAPRRQRTVLAHQLADRQKMTKEVAEELATYEATFDEIEAATAAMDVQRAGFEKILNDPPMFAERTRHLFAEDRFASYRYPVGEVRRACEATAYPEPPAQGDAGYAQFLNLATAYLADKKDRLRIGRELLRMLPDYVAEDRLLDAWIIQFCAYHLVETPNETNPFLIQMLEHGLNAWRGTAPDAG